MQQDERTKRRYTEIWETFEIRDRELELAETRTMNRESQTRLPGEFGAPFARDLPRIRETREPGETMPEVQLGDSLGEGGTAQVLRALQVPLDREVAVKKVRDNPEIDEATYALLQEAWVIGKLEHPNIVPVYRLGRDDDGDPVIVMKRIEGVSWETLIRDPSAAPREFDSDDPLDWHVEILMEVCDALDYAHDLSIIHRDLKPENVMVGAFGEVYLVDWGLAVSVADDEKGRLPRAEDVTEPAGTPAYMAPEMSEGAGERLGITTDVYQLGAILHRIVTGGPPHQGESLFDVMYSAYQSEPREYDADIPDRLTEICTRAMARDPADRHRSAREFRGALRDYKHYRRSIRLTREADQRRTEFAELLQADDPDEARVYEAFGECRFGFEQALEVDEENAEAREGLQSIMETMIEWELDHEGYKAASLLIADLPRERPDLEDRLETLREERADREREYEKLKEREREHDVERGRKTRSIFVFGMGLVMGALSYAPGVLQSVMGFSLGYGDLFVQMLIVGVAIGAGLWIGRRGLFQNAANRKLVGSLLWLFTTILVLRKSALKTGIELEAAMAFENLVSAGGAGIIAVCVDRRVFWAAVPYVLGAALTAEFSSAAYAIDGLTDVVALGLLAVAWWPGHFESLAGPIAGD